MNWLRRYKFKARLGLLVAVFLIGFLVVGAWAFGISQRVSSGLPPLQIGFLIGLFTVVLGLAVVIHRSILQPLDQAVAIANEVAGGHYQQPPTVVYPDEAGNLLKALHEMGNSLERSMGDLHEAKRDAQAASHFKGDLLANLSHEIRTPMNAIVGLSTLALKNDIPPRTQHYLFKIQQSGEHLLHIIDSVLEFSRIESGRLNMECVPFELKSVIDNVIDPIAVKAEQQGLELLCHVDHHMPKILIGDPLRIGQILSNFVENALRYTKAGEVRVNATVMERADSHVHMRLSVSDTGIGLTPEHIARLLNRDEHADKPTDPEFGGIGLGLAISNSLAHAMGGTLGVESVYGRGATFWFSARLAIGGQEKNSGESGREGILDAANGTTPLRAQMSAHAAFDASAIVARLRMIPNLDVDMGLHGASGDLPFYVSLLTKFISGQADAVARICRRLNTGDRAGAGLVAHTLKSVAANLGMQGLASRAEDLEQMVSAHATLEARNPLITQTQELLDAMIAHLDAALGLRATPSNIAVTGLAPEEFSAPHTNSGGIQDAV